MTWRQESSEVFYTDTPQVRVTTDDFIQLKEAALASPRQRARLCAHPDPDDSLHEMIIVLTRDAYIRPHRHHNKSESFHLVEGGLRVFQFDERGEIRGAMTLGPPGSDHPFYCRSAALEFHSVRVKTDFVVFHETTPGPFDPKDTEYASWAPADDDLTGQQEFFHRLDQFPGKP